MLSEDHLIRMINLAITALLEIVGLKKAGNYETALQRIDLVMEMLLGLRANMAKNLDDERLYFLLTRNDRLDTQRLELIADLFAEEGDIYAAQDRTAESRADYARALKYFIEVLFNEVPEDPSELKQKIEELADHLDLPALGADVLWPLAGYYEETGAYGKAEALLLILVGRPEIREGLRPELVTFYERMLEKPPAALAQAGMDLGQVRERLNQWKEA